MIFVLVDGPLYLWINLYTINLWAQNTNLICSVEQILYLSKATLQCNRVAWHDPSMAAKNLVAVDLFAGQQSVSLGFRRGLKLYWNRQCRHEWKLFHALKRSSQKKNTALFHLQCAQSKALYPHVDFLMNFLW